MMLRDRARSIIAASLSLRGPIKPRFGPAEPVPQTFERFFRSNVSRAGSARPAHHGRSAAKVAGGSMLGATGSPSFHHEGFRDTATGHHGPKLREEDAENSR
ncbi:MAG: hypothetical protein EA377_00265 [Phycisphaerales bacterium]|nr:MAG: hypothetical protein EA377_00265 [Phycisphaerales bacterium]